MFKSISALGTLALLFCASCYSPNVGAVRYSCDETNPYCPDGLECSGGVCVTPGSGGNNNSDGPPPPPPSDGGSTVMGCRYGGGTDLGAGVFACPGAFNSRRNNGLPRASELCANGATICGAPRTANMQLCNTLPGFFGSTQPARYDSGNKNNANSYSCQERTGPGFNNRAVSGCGRLTNSMTADKNCNGFLRILDCDAVDSWSCNSSILDDSHDNTNAADGVLCCLP